MLAYVFNSGRADTFLDRQSGLWGAQTPLGLWLEENKITTLFLGGVNIDQCVVSLGNTNMPLSRWLTSPVGNPPRWILQGIRHVPRPGYLSYGQPILVS